MATGQSVEELVREAKAQSATELDLSDQGLTELPASLAEVRSLTSLKLARNRLRALPEWFARLTNLTSLAVSGNSLEALPEGMRQNSESVVVGSLSRDGRKCTSDGRPNRTRASRPTCTTTARALLIRD